MAQVALWICAISTKRCCSFSFKAFRSTASGAHGMCRHFWKEQHISVLPGSCTFASSTMNAKSYIYIYTYSAKKFNNLLSSISRLLYYILHATAAINCFLCNTFFSYDHISYLYIFNPCPRSIPSGPSSIPCASAGVHQQWHQRLLALGLSLRSICSQVHLYQRVPSLPNTSRTHQEAMHWSAANTFQYVSVQVDCAFSTAEIAWDLSSHIHGVRALGHLHLGVILVTVLLKWSHWVIHVVTVPHCWSGWKSILNIWAFCRQDSP